MFQSYLSHGYEFTIIDSDFQETIDNFDDRYSVEEIIYIYSRRNLNVALNLVLFMQYQYKEHGDDYSIDKQILRYKNYGRYKDFKKYLPEINKYMSLI